MPGVPSPPLTVMMIFDSRGASAAARCRATFSRSALPALLAAVAASRNVAHEVASRPSYS
jgi:hypothetical protein